MATGHRRLSEGVGEVFFCVHVKGIQHWEASGTIFGLEGTAMQDESSIL